MCVRILVDLDDTLEDMLTPWVEAINSRYGTDVSPNDITDWEMTQFFPTLTKRQIFEPVNKPEFWARLKPKHGAEHYVQKLFNEGYELFVCTSSYCRNIPAKYEHIVKKYFPCIDWEHMIITRNKQMIKADYLVDDAVHNLVGGDYIKILMTMPHNKNYDAFANGMRRADNWEDVYLAIKMCELRKKEGVTK